MWAPPHEPRQWGPRTHRREFAQPTSTLMLAWRIPHSNHPDAAALSMLASILGDGRAAWLYKQFHDEQGLAHDVNACAMPDRHGEGALIRSHAGGKDGKAASWAFTRPVDKSTTPARIENR